MGVVIAIIGFVLVSIWGIYWGGKNYYKSQYEKTRHKFSDADIFKLMARANHFLTNEQLAAVSPFSVFPSFFDLYDANRRVCEVFLVVESWQSSFEFFDDFRHS